MNPLERIMRYLGGDFSEPQQAQTQGPTADQNLADMLRRKQEFEAAQAATARQRLTQQGQPGEVGWSGVTGQDRVLGYLLGQQ